MEFSRLSSPSLKDLFVREIENMIISGKLSIGDRLPPERELAEKMGVSRAVVNSGLTELAGIGFVEIKPRIGAFVADYHRRGTVETLMAILRYNGGNLKKTEMKSLLEIRLVFETLALELLVPAVSESDIGVLMQLADNFGKSRTPENSAETIFIFHQELCILSGNTMLPVIFYSFKELSTMLWEKYFTLHGNEQLYKNTLELVKNIKEKDTKGAVSTFQESLKKTINGIVSIYDE